MFEHRSSSKWDGNRHRIVSEARVPLVDFVLDIENVAEVAAARTRHRGRDGARLVRPRIKLSAGSPVPPVSRDGV